MRNYLSARNVISWTWRSVYPSHCFLDPDTLPEFHSHVHPSNVKRSYMEGDMIFPVQSYRGDSPCRSRAADLMLRRQTYTRNLLGFTPRG